MAKAEKENEKDEKKTSESQFAILESKKTSLTKALEEAKAARDEAITMTNSFKSEQERSVRVAKEEVEKKVTRVIFERDEAIKAFEAEKAN